MLQVECPVCDGEGQFGEVNCRSCDGEGFYKFDKCPRQTIDPIFVEAANLTIQCGNGVLPVAGGLLDQSSWFLDVWQMLQAERDRIDAERPRSE